MKAIKTPLFFGVLSTLCCIPGCQRLPDCVDTVKRRVVSPEQRTAVVILERDCGATTGFSTLVRLIPANSSSEGTEKDNIFVCKGEAGRVDATWLSERELAITHDCQEEEIFKNSPGSGEIHVAYRFQIGRK